MGNNISNQLKTKYERGHFKVTERKEDTLVGGYEVISFQNSRNRYLQKDLDPTEYNDDIESSTFQNKLHRQCKYICDFYFVTYDRHSTNHYKMIYEYGVPFQSVLTKEKYIWYFIRQVVKAGIYLEDNCLHYPYLGRQYIIQKEAKHFKLVNPFCFPDFLKEVIKIYMSPKEHISTRRKYSAECIQKNTFQLSFLIVSIITGTSEFELKNDLHLLQSDLNTIKGKDYSGHLIEFLFFLFQDKPKRFIEIEQFMESMGIDFRNPKSRPAPYKRSHQLHHSVLTSPGISRQIVNQNTRGRVSLFGEDSDIPQVKMNSGFKATLMPKRQPAPPARVSEMSYDLNMQGNFINIRY